MNKTLLYIVAAAAAGGFLFGFDSGVISGCEKAIQSEFSLSAFWHGLVILLVILLFFGNKYDIVGKDRMEDANEFLDRAGKMADSVKKEFREG